MANEDYTSSFEQCLEQDGTANISQQNLRSPATEMYKNLTKPTFFYLKFYHRNIFGGIYIVYEYERHFRSYVNLLAVVQLLILTLISKPNKTI